MSFNKLLKRFFLDGPDSMEVTRRLFLEESPEHSFSVDYERADESDKVVLYECRKDKIMRVYLFRDKDKHVSPKKSVTLSDIKDSAVYRQVFRYACKKGLMPEAVHHYFDFSKKAKD